MSTIAERLLLLRGKAKQGDFAKELGINPNTLRSYENGRTSPNQDFLEQLCVQFQVSPEWLLLGRGSIYPGEQSTSHLEAHPSLNSCAKCAVLEAENKLLHEFKTLQDETIKAQAETIKMYKTAFDIAQQESFKGDHGITVVPPSA